MATLRTDYTDRTWEGDRKYTITDNGDDTYTIEDVTEYENDEYSAFGAADINATNEKVNEIGDGNLNDFSFYQISSTQGGYSMDGGETIIPFRNPTGDAEESDVLDGVIFSSAELEDAEGTMTDKQGTTTTATPSLDSSNSYLKMQIPARGCYDTSSYLRAAYSTIRSLISLTAAKIRSGYTILGLAGTFTSDATATAARILKGYTAGVNGSMVTGTMTNRGAVSVTIDPGESYTVTAGYHNGSGTVTANDPTVTSYNFGTGVSTKYGGASITTNGTNATSYTLTQDGMVFYSGWISNNEGGSSVITIYKNGSQVATFSRGYGTTIITPRSFSASKGNVISISASYTQEGSAGINVSVVYAN